MRNKLAFNPYDRNWRPIDNGVIVSIQEGENARAQYARVVGWHISSGLEEGCVAHPTPKLEYKVRMLATHLEQWVSFSAVQGFLRGVD